MSAKNKLVIDDINVIGADTATALAGIVLAKFELLPLDMQKALRYAYAESWDDNMMISDWELLYGDEIHDTRIVDLEGLSDEVKVVRLYIDIYFDDTHNILFTQLRLKTASLFSQPIYWKKASTVVDSRNDAVLKVGKIVEDFRQEWESLPKPADEESSEES